MQKNKKLIKKLTNIKKKELEEKDTKSVEETKKIIEKGYKNQEEK